MALNPLDVSSAKQGVTLSNSAVAFEPTRAIHVDVAGSATVTWADGGVTAFASLAAGLYPYSIRKLTAGTATVVGLY